MTRALVVLDSMYGNTQTIARAIADGLSTRMAVDIVEVGRAPAALGEDVKVLIVGGPTHAFGMSREGTRRTAAEQAEHGVVSTGIGVREWLGALKQPLGNIAAGAFDTSIAKARWVGLWAQRRVRRRSNSDNLECVSLLPRRASSSLTRPDLWVAGEEERARAWGERLGSEDLAQRN